MKDKKLNQKKNLIFKNNYCEREKKSCENTSYKEEDKIVTKQKLRQNTNCDNIEHLIKFNRDKSQFRKRVLLRATDNLMYPGKCFI